MKILATACVAMLLSVIISCHGKNESPKVQEISLLERSEEPTVDFKVDHETNKQYATDSAGTYQVPGKNKQPQTTTPAANPDWDKKIVKNATLELEIKEYKAFYASLREKVRSVGGYIAQEEQNESDYKIENTLIIKVPVDQFDNSIALLTSNVEKINAKKISSQDVTTEFVDTKSRMEAKKQVRQRYMDLLKQAKNMEEILNVQSEINGIQEEIESANGRIDYLSHSSAMSTINLTFFQVLNVTAKNNDNPSFGTKLGNAFKSGGSWVVELLIGLVTIWPLFLMSAIVIIGYKKLKNQRAKA
ncbi:MAG TPA: DUF4349 domain-containing protein [Chitinophagaceae bacterium]